MSISFAFVYIPLLADDVLGVDGVLVVDDVLGVEGVLVVEDILSCALMHFISVSILFSNLFMRVPVLFSKSFMRQDRP